MKMLRVLIVDPDPVARSYVSDLLGRCGFYSVEAESGTRALQLATTDPFDLIVMDARLPGMDGPQFLDLVLDGAFGHKPPPLIVCSAYLHEQVWVRKLALPGVVLLAKPFAAEPFAAALDAAFSAQ
jgi:CheY-like chemotaxis protein